MSYVCRIYVVQYIWHIPVISIEDLSEGHGLYMAVLWMHLISQTLYLSLHHGNREKRHSKFNQRTIA